MKIQVYGISRKGFVFFSIILGIQFFFTESGLANVDSAIVRSIWDKLEALEERWPENGRIVWTQALLETNNPRLSGRGASAGASSFRSEFFFSKEGFYLKRESIGKSSISVNHYFSNSLEQILYSETARSLRIGLSVAEEEPYVVTDARRIISSGRGWLEKISPNDVINISLEENGNLILTAEQAGHTHVLVLDPRRDYLSDSWEIINAESGRRRIFSYLYSNGGDEDYAGGIPKEVVYKSISGGIQTKLAYVFEDVQLGLDWDEVAVRKDITKVKATVYDERVPGEGFSYFASWPKYSIPDYEKFLEIHSNQNFLAAFIWQRKHLGDKINND
jgi:hypothetical protein